MRKLKLQVQTTVDLYMGGVDGAMDWMNFDWSDDMTEYVGALTDSVDTIVLGRKLAEGFIPTWAAGPEHEDQKSIDWMNNTPKVVVSNTLTESPWDNATVLSGDITAGINELKSRPGKDIITYGGATLAANLIAAGLIDDLHLIVNPTAIGAGLPVFGKDAYTKLTLVESKAFECGNLALHFQPTAS